MSLATSANPNSRKVKVGIVGVGNCASSFVQGVKYYEKVSDGDAIPGLMHPVLGGYNVSDIEFVSAFDVDSQKVGQDLSKAIFAGQNNTHQFTEVDALGVQVVRGPTHDGIGKYLSEVIEESPHEPVDVVKHLKETGTQVLVCYLPVGSEEATFAYAEAALQAGCGFVNCIPVFVAGKWGKRFEEAGVPIVGDDIKSQVGATILHRNLVRLFEDRGVKIERTYQLNFGGNTDFLNMLERERLESKKISKTQAVTSQVEADLPDSEVHVGPSDHVPWLGDRKWCHIRIEGTTFGDVPLNAEVKLEVWDSPNSAGVVIDAVRCAQLALDRNIGGVLDASSAYFMKSPPRQMRDEDARDRLEKFIAG